MASDWTIVRIRGNRGPPTLDGADFLSCVSAVRNELEGVRWHFRWVLDSGRSTRDGLRVELHHNTPEMKRLIGGLEARVPPPDSVVFEPLQTDLDLDDVQTEAEMDLCLELLWRHSEFIADLRGRNPSLTASNIRDLTPGAFLTLVTSDRRHLERAIEELGIINVAPVAFGRVMHLVRQADLSYRVPPATKADACAAARIHHLSGCTFASRYYPFRRIG